MSEASKSIHGATQKVIGVKDSIVGYFGDDKSAKPADKPAPAKSIFFTSWLNIEIFTKSFRFQKQAAHHLL